MIISLGLRVSSWSELNSGNPVVLKTSKSCYTMITISRAPTCTTTHSPIFSRACL